MNHEWRKHPRLINLLHPDYPDDLQVVVHDGGTRLTSRHPELVWVRITKYAEGVFTGRVLNQPSQLSSVSEGSEILFILPEYGEHPLLVTEKYLKERHEWIICPCEQCGLSELFDAPSDLIHMAFPGTPKDSTVSVFTTFCGVCGGVQGVQHKSSNPETFEAASNQYDLGKAWWKFWK